LASQHFYVLGVSRKFVFWRIKKESFDMRFDVVTLFPAMFDVLLSGGITQRALDRQLAELHLWNPRDFAQDKHRTVDDRPYGGGPGMVMMVEPLRTTIRAAREQAGQTLGAKPQVILLSPQGKPLKQADLAEFARQPGLVLVAGRYEGIDERLIQTEIDAEVSLGDFVLSGGEIAALALIDGVTRLLPGALGAEDSAEQDSFVAGILDCPHYTRPEVIDDMAVPPVLLSGDHQAIARWRLKQALGATWLKRPDLLADLELDETQEKLLEEFKQEYEPS
jgi:tRNA (guanine37-N1)-methyltransferase